jgi:hypothetical protein
LLLTAITDLPSCCLPTHKHALNALLDALLVPFESTKQVLPRIMDFNQQINEPFASSYDDVNIDWDAIDREFEPQPIEVATGAGLDSQAW